MLAFEVEVHKCPIHRAEGLCILLELETNHDVALLVCKHEDLLLDKFEKIMTEEGERAS